MISVGIYCGIVAWLEIYYWKLDQNSDVKNTMVLHSILGFALSMLLVFRTNTAYDRWWGRKKNVGNPNKPQQKHFDEIECCITGHFNR